MELVVVEATGGNAMRRVWVPVCAVRNAPVRTVLVDHASLSAYAQQTHTCVHAWRNQQRRVCGVPLSRLLSQVRKHP